MADGKLDAAVVAPDGSEGDAGKVGPAAEGALQQAEGGIGVYWLKLQAPIFGESLL